MVGAIPARFAATRLPGKPLLPIAGKPMIEHVYRRATEAANLDRVVVLTDDERIAAAVRGFGGEVEMTPAECASGTDRIAWAARNWDAAAVVNIQGDEPLIDPSGIAALVAHLRAHPEEDMATLAAVAVEEDFDDPNSVKVVLDGAGYALYFSRSRIPYPRNAESPGATKLWKHLGIYGYRKDVLLRFAALPPTELEVTESLEQLRALYHGIRIRVLPAAKPSIGVDTAADLARVERMLAAEGGGAASSAPTEAEG
ncbi:MAG: 3-deoxy-manno-octulosonate cytidylyltransferase, partial [Thermoanaerobaculia bacterium]|nr:3-deoxy-manno-octulosonate cytidylyltransferase [Thermoanaerobaculia bacterium]